MTSKKALPATVNICGVIYDIIYFDKVIEVDDDGEDGLYGQIHYRKRKIRIFRGERPYGDIWQSIMHEILHGMGMALHLESFNKKDNHRELDLLATTLTDTLFRNGWMA